MTATPLQTCGVRMRYWKWIMRNNAGIHFNICLSDDSAVPFTRSCATQFKDLSSYVHAESLRCIEMEITIMINTYSQTAASWTAMYLRNVEEANKSHHSICIQNFQHKQQPHIMNITFTDLGTCSPSRTLILTTSAGSTCAHVKNWNSPSKQVAKCTFMPKYSARNSSTSLPATNVTLDKKRRRNQLFYRPCCLEACKTEGKVRGEMFWHLKCTLDERRKLRLAGARAADYLFWRKALRSWTGHHLKAAQRLKVRRETTLKLVLAEENVEDGRYRSSR